MFEGELKQRYDELYQGLDKLVAKLYKQGCPCQYPRIVHLLQWDKALRFLEQETLFGIMTKHLNKEQDNHYTCPHCGTRYVQYWDQYSINLWVLNVEITPSPNLATKGAPVLPQVPYSFGFQGHDLSRFDLSGYVKADNNSLIEYLKAISN